MPINASPEYKKAEAKFQAAGTDEQRLEALEEMISTMPTHKGAESLRKNIRTRYKKLKQKLEKREKQHKKTRKREGIKKQGIQAVLCGLTNSGKSSLLSELTNANPLIAAYDFTTKSPLVGIIDYKGIKFQIIDMPSINYENFDQGLANNADILLLIINNVDDLKNIEPFLKKANGKKIVVLNKVDRLNTTQKRKQKATLQTEKYTSCLISCKTKQGISELKEKLLENSGIDRIYTKQPGKQKDEIPVLLPPNSTLKDVAEKILHGFSKNIKQARITGPSSKFPNQKVGLDHIVKDKDIIEFKTK